MICCINRCRIDCISLLVFSYGICVCLPLVILSILQHVSPPQVLSTRWQPSIFRLHYPYAIIDAHLFSWGTSSFQIDVAFLHFAVRSFKTSFGFLFSLLPPVLQNDRRSHISYKDVQNDPCHAGFKPVACRCPAPNRVML